MLSNEYVAGLFDGEGNIHIGKSLCHLQVSVTQKDPEVLLLLQSQFKGKVITYSGSGKYRKNECYRWRCHACADSEDFLTAIFPYSIIKKSEIWIALMFLADQSKRNLRYNPLTDKQKELRQNCRNSLLTIHGDRFGQLV